MHMLNLISQIVIYYIYVYYCNSVEANCLLQSVTRRTLAIVVSFDFFYIVLFFPRLKEKMECLPFNGLCCAQSH